MLNGTLKDVLLAVQPRRTAAASFDHLVGAGEQRRRHVETERVGGLEVDDQFELGRRLHRKTIDTLESSVQNRHPHS